MAIRLVVKPPTISVRECQDVYELLLARPWDSLSKSFTLSEDRRYNNVDSQKEVKVLLLHESRHCVVS